MRLPHTVVPSAVEEVIPADADPATIARDLALLKAHDVARNNPGCITIGADTIVVLDNQILGKPVDTADAVGMLRSLSARTHCVITGVALVCYPPDTGLAQTQTNIARELVFHQSTRVTFSDLSDYEIECYVATRSPMDKAGSYGIQDDLGSLFVTHIDGDYYNVVGLPVQKLFENLKSFAPELVSVIFGPEHVPNL